MRAITVCVEYADFLAITLPRNAQHFDEVMVVTAPQDRFTAEVVESVPNASCYVTDAFYRQGAAFNKGLALEEGLDALGRRDWLVIFDADVVMPAEMNILVNTIGNLYGAHRRICQDPHQWDGGEDWSAWPILQDRELAGWFQLFHADDPVLKERPWYGTNWRHAGGCDSVFQDRWPANRKIWLPMEVLHLGEPFTNWYGRHTPYVDGRRPPQADQRRQAMDQMRRDRRRHGFQKELLNRR